MSSVSANSKLSLRRIIRYYLIFCGVLVHLAGGYALTVIAFELFADHWRVKAVERWLAGTIDDSSIFELPQTVAGVFDYATLPTGRWVKIHQQKRGDAVRFNRQAHSGSAWDSRRRRLLVFGSDTHGKNWDNSVYSFELDQLRWRRAYQADPSSTYRADKNGLPVAGIAGDRPWAMHTFDAINYHAKDDSLVVASYPAHLKPGRVGDWLGNTWADIRKHPTWVFSFPSGIWRAAKGKSVSFFPYSSAYDSDRDLIVGFRSNGIFEFRGDEKGWKKVAKCSVQAWHTQAVYDSEHKVFAIFGTDEMSNAVHIYKPGESRSRKMPTKGLRPPGASSPPLAYNSKLAKVVAVIDTNIQGKELAQTWLYDTGVDKWELAPEADFPFKLGMNYHMQYSQADDILLLLAGAPHEPPSLWVLRL